MTSAPPAPDSDAARLWRPAASLDTLRLRARLLAGVRSFFAARGVLEVETPVLGTATVTDVHIESFRCAYHPPFGSPRELYLQTSPEFALKRLVAAGYGPVYQLGKVFRDGEAGRLHNPEFTMLEWYRPGWDHHALMAEVDELLQALLGTAPAERLSYGQAFERHLGIDPHRAGGPELLAAARRRGGEVPGLAADDRDGWLHWLLTSVVEPHLGRGRPVLLYDFPASQAALARVRQEPGGPAVAERFEAYVEGVELANGYHELTDGEEQRRRFAADLEQRRHRGQPAVPVDERFLAALAAGLPACAGVSIGVDRLVMLAAGAASIEDVLSFPVARA